MLFRTNISENRSTDIDSLKHKKFETIAKSRLCIVRNEFEKGVTSLAFPVLGSNQDLLGTWLVGA